MGSHLEFRDAATSSVTLDGAWWVATRESAEELAGLVTALDARQVQVRLLMLNPHGWHGHPRRIELGDRSIRIEWMSMLDRSVVIGATARGGRIDLLLMTPDEPAPPQPVPSQPTPDQPTP